MNWNKIFSILLIIVGILIILFALPLMPLSIVRFGPLEATDIPTINATRITVGVIVTIFGIIIYYGKEVLKFLLGK